MRTLINNTYIRITLPSIHSDTVFNFLKSILKKTIRIFVVIYRFPDKHPFYYREEEERFKLERDRIRAKSPWL